MELATKGIYRELFGVENDQEVYLFTFINDNGNKVSITNYGGIITSWNVTDKDGAKRDIVLGFNDLSSYLQPHPYFGVIAGRYANRIAHGRFQLDAKIYQVSQNEMPHHLHGGHKGFDKVVWTAAIENDTLVLSYTSEDGEEGYPGNLNVTVIYSYDNEDALCISYKAITDKATPVNLTGHCYFNLTGNAANDVLTHVLHIDGNQYLPVDDKGIPTGEIASVHGSKFDFTASRPIQNIDGFKDYDHNYVLNDFSGKLRSVALLAEGTSGLQLEVLTTEPGMQLYTGIHLDGSFQNKTGENMQPYSGVCLETQHFPDSPHHPHFPNTILYPGEVYRSMTVYKIGIL